jgi:signal transduction histidine kinase
MLLTHALRQAIERGWHRARDHGWSWSSLQVRLTLEMGAIAVLSVGGAALWSAWQMQQTLAAAHKQTLTYIAQRFPEQLELYDERGALTTGLTTTIDKVSMSGLMAWVQDNRGQTIAQPEGNSPAIAMMQGLATVPEQPTIIQVGDRYWVACRLPLVVRDRRIGRVYFAQDVSHDWQTLNGSLRWLLAVNGLAMLAAMGAIGRRIRRALLPLADMSQVASTVSADDLGGTQLGTQLQLQTAPDEVRGLAQAFNDMLGRLANSWEQQRQFVGNVSHELRTPLTVVSGYLQSVLRRGTNLNDYQREALTTAEAEADRTVRMLQDLLDLARLDNRQLHLRQAPIVLNTLVTEAADLHQRSSDRPIERSLPTEDLVVLADRDRLSRALMNLLDNAVKYSAPPTPIALILERVGDRALVHVRDQGVGIPLAHQERVFERFYRSDDEMTRSRDGTGLGLAIAKGAIEGMNGRISLVSQPGSGSTFTISLPLWRPEA